jgi:two-component system cell cycle response regulator
MQESGSQVRHGRRPNVLIADDQEDKRIMLSKALELEGCNIILARDGREALEIVEAEQPDLVITDVRMPRMDGFELARAIRSNPRTRFVPVIIQTSANNEAEDVLRGSEAGALGYFTDPSDLGLLLARARTLIDFRQYLDSCEEAAFTDHLTGLANRRRFERQLAREVNRTIRYGHAFCLLLLDIDHFKRINDTFGHDMGDEVLRHLGRALQEATRGIDLAARVGGEEFAVILPETKLEPGWEVADRLRETIEHLRVPTVGIVTASFGVAEFPACASSSSILLNVADVAMYEAKSAGRNRVCRAKVIEENNPVPGGV